MWELDQRRLSPEELMLLTCSDEETLRVHWTARRSNQSILKEISPEYSSEGLMLKLTSNTLATWCEELIQWKRPWCWEIEGKRRRGWQRIRWLDDITDLMDINLNKLRETVKDREDWHAAVHESQRVRHYLVTEQQWQKSTQHCKKNYLPIKTFFKRFPNISCEIFIWNFKSTIAIFKYISVCSSRSAYPWASRLYF